jgi:hypothetical protein
MTFGFIQHCTTVLPLSEVFMKTIALPVFFLFAIVLCSPRLDAQGVTFISNLELDQLGSAAVANDAWVAQSFTTGTNAVGYVLNTVQIAMSPASGSPNRLSVLLYSANGAYPGDVLMSLSGPNNPSAGGVISFTASDFALLPANTYWIVLTAESPLSAGAYTANIASFFGYAASDGWWTDRYYAESVNGSRWSVSPVGVDLQFAVGATAVPEPTSLALLSLAGLCHVARSLKRRLARGG